MKMFKGRSTKNKAAPNTSQSAYFQKREGKHSEKGRKKGDNLATRQDQDA